MGVSAKEVSWELKKIRVRRERILVVHTKNEGKAEALC